MKRIISLLVCMLLVITSLMARTPEQAAKVASGFLSTRGTQMSVAQRTQRAARVTAVPTDVTMVYTQLQKDSQEPAVYVFNGERDGFVLVSAGDEGRVVLGYSDSGKFDKDDIPANMQFWLQMYADELASSVATPSKAPAKGSLQKMSKAAAASYPTVYPILDGVKWGQGEPFNNNCPVATGGDKTVTGCVATAISQIMYAHKYPSPYGTGSHSYYCESLGRTLSVDFSSTWLNWDLMKGDYSTGWDNAQAWAVGALMYSVGVASEMSYGVNGSGAVSPFALYGLAKYFGYNKGVVPYPKGCMPESEILNAIATDLQVGRPVYISGRTVNNEGHAFVCDGIKSDGYLHINWGWNGVCDGYFAFSVLDPENQGTGGSASNDAFTEGVVAYTNIKPEAGGTLVPMWTAAGLYRNSGATSSRGDNNYFNMPIFQCVGLGDIFDISVVLNIYDSYGNWVDQIGLGLFSDWPAGAYIENYTFYFYIGNNLPDGSYNVEVAVEDNNGNSTPVLVEGLGVARIPMTISGDAIYFGETSPVEYDYTIRVRKSEGCTMNLSSGAWLWYWLPGDAGAGVVEMTLVNYGGNDWYTANVRTTSNEINCLVVNKNVADGNWSGSQQTVDFNGITGDVCLEIGGASTKYNLVQTDCAFNFEVSNLQVNVTCDAERNVNAFWEGNAPYYAIYVYNSDWTVRASADKWEHTSAQLGSVVDGTYYWYVEPLDEAGESAGEGVMVEFVVDCDAQTSEPELDLNFTHGHSHAYGDVNDELHLWSEDEGTKMCFDLYCDYANSILGTYIVQNNNSSGCCNTFYSYIDYNGVQVKLSSGCVTIIKDAAGDFVLSFDVYDENGTHYVNTCTILASRIDLENNADISGTGVTALTPLEAKTITENLTHTDLTDIPFLVKGVVSTMRNTPDQIITYGSARFDISEDGSSVDQFYCYNTKWLNNTSCTTGYEIELGDEVVVYGNLQNYLGSTPEIKGYVYQSIKASGIYYSLDVIASQGGYVDIYPMEDAYAAGSYVSLTAVAYEGYHFLGWSDGVTDAVRTIQMNSDIYLEAYFEALPVKAFNIRVKLDENSTMDVSNGMWIWWWSDSQAGMMVPAEYDGSYYAVTINATSEYVNCLVTNGPNWDEVTAQTKDFEGVYGDICLAVGNYLEFVNGKESYAIGVVDCETGAAPDLDLNLTHGYSHAYGYMNDELHLWSEDEATEMCFDLYCDYANSILGTYIVQHSGNTGSCNTSYSYVVHNGNKVNLSSGYVTIVKDAVGDFVLSFDVYDENGTHYVNTCAILASRIGLENNADISGTGVTALTPLEAKTITENLTHTDLTDIPFLVKGVVSTMRNTPDQIITYGSARFDISEDGSSVDQFYCYNTKWLNNTSCTTGYEIELGDEVVVYGNLQNYLGSTPEIKGYVYQSIKASGIYYSLDVIASQGGYVDIYPMEDAYAAGSYVSLTAVAYEGYHFLGWSDGVTDAVRTIQMNSDISLEAYFEVEGGAGPADCYTLTLYPTADANEGGYAYAAPSFNCYEPGTDVIIRAHAFDGYVFVRWNDGNTDAERTIVMNANSSYTAYFELEQTAPCYTLTIAETVGGEVILSPEKDCYEQGEQVTLFAMADEGYRFVRWSDGNTNMQRILSMNSDVMLSAIFEQITYTLVLQESEGGYSVATPAKGQYLAGEQVTVEAIAYEDYQFVCWNDGNSEQERVLTMDKDYVLQPTFVEVNIPEGFYTLILTHTEGGNVTKSPDNLYYESGDVVYVEALPNDGYEFINWSDGEIDKLRRITVTENITLHANFAEIVADTQYTLTLTAGTGGSVSASPSKATYNEGDMVVINAVAEENYKFEKWNDGVLEARRVIEMNENKTFHATFKRIPTDYDVTDLSITGSSLRATAQWKSAAEWYRVVVVNASDAEIKNEVKNITGDKKKYSFTAPRNGTYTITIEPLDNTDEHASLAPAVSGSVTLIRLYSLEIVANNGGTVNDEVNATNYEYGDEVQIVATPKEGYRFLNWSDENTEATRTLTMDQDYYLEANFKRIPTYTLTIYEGEHCTAFLEPGSYTYQENHVITLTPIAEDGYEFVHWIVNGIENPTSELQLVMTMNYDVYPVAKEIPKPTYTLTILDSEFGTTSIAPGVYTYSENEMVTITATANEDYIFDRWMVNGEASSTDNILALTMLMDYVVEATFKPNKVAVDNVYTDILINVQQRTLYVQASMSMDMAIYDLVGHLLHRKNNTTSLVYDLPAAGVYVLRTGDGVQKIRIE